MYFSLNILVELSTMFNYMFLYGLEYLSVCILWYVITFALNKVS